MAPATGWTILVLADDVELRASSSPVAAVLVSLIFTAGKTQLQAQYWSHVVHQD